MVRPAVVLALLVLVTSCSSADPPAPSSGGADGSSAAAGPSTGAAASSAGAAPSTADPSTADPSTADAATIAWAGRFCTAAQPLTELGALPEPDTTSGAATRTSLLSFYTAGADDLTRAATALDAVGPPPVAGAETLTSDAAGVLRTSGSRFATLAGQAQATDPADAAAVGTLASDFADAVSALQSAFATLNTSRAPQVSAAIAQAPACRALGGGTAPAAGG